MKTNSRSNAAFLWDESFLWGLMAHKALKSNNLPFELIRSNDICEGRLGDYAMLFVPGGWASQKLKALGAKGIGEIRRFVGNGGNYVGFCGGAGLATQDGIGLSNIARKPTKERVPSFNGRIYLNTGEHPIWKGLRPACCSSHVFHAWWPSQFLIKDKSIKILAAYGDALPDSFSSDVNVGDVKAGSYWSEIEKQYRINLNPERLKDEPAVIEGTFGKGRVILSLIHFDTPDDENGATVLRNLWGYLDPGAECNDKPPRRKQRGIIRHAGLDKPAPAGIKPGASSELELVPDFRRDDVWIPAFAGMMDSRQVAGNVPAVIKKSQRPSLSPTTPDQYQQFETLSCSMGPTLELLSGIETAVTGLITLGIQNFLWFWRTPMLLQWRRGVRGMEYCTLYAMLKGISERLKHGNIDRNIQTEMDLIRIRGLLMPFIEKAKRLLLLERYAMQNGHITYETHMSQRDTNPNENNPPLPPFSRIEPLRDRRKGGLGGFSGERCDIPEIQKIRAELFSNSKSHGGLFKKLIDDADGLLYKLLPE